MIYRKRSRPGLRALCNIRTFQQDGINKKAWYVRSASHKGKHAQDLYVGQNQPKPNETNGLITYMRTVDSGTVSRHYSWRIPLNYIKDTYGNDYVGKVKFKQKDNAQDAHED